MEVARSLVDITLLELINANIATGGTRDDIQEMAFYRLEKIGFTIGEKLISSLLATSPAPPTDHLQIMKYICCDFWQHCFNKQIDTLKTNHRGVFVLVDNDVAALRPFVMGAGGGEEAARWTVLYLAVPCGLVRGALSGGFQVKATVKAQLTCYPICSFDVQII